MLDTFRADLFLSVDNVRTGLEKQTGARPERLNHMKHLLQVYLFIISHADFILSIYHLQDHLQYVQDLTEGFSEYYYDTMER